MHTCLVKTPGNHIATGSKTLLIGAINTLMDNKLFSTHVKRLLAYRRLFPCS